MNLILKFLSKYSFLTIFSLINFSYYPINTLAGENIENKNDFIDKIINKSKTFYESDYLLGSGDVLSIKFEELELFSGKYPVNADGFIYLPEIKKLNVKGLTVKELELLMTKIYEEFVEVPIINASVIIYRPVNFYLTGEIKSPGLYSLRYLENSDVSNEKIDQLSPANYDLLNSSQNQSLLGIGNRSISLSSGQIAPKLFDALQKGEGLTNFADLSKIKIVRKNSISNGGGKIQANINLLDMINSGDQSNNIRILDGDSIIIPRNDKPIKEQILAIYKTNLNPNFVTVYITGNVENKGPINLKKGSGLIQAIASSGGKKLLTGNVEFIRFNDDGSTKKTKFNYDANAKINTPRNPILMDGDIINVNKTLLGSATEVLTEFTKPFLSGFALYEIFYD